MDFEATELPVPTELCGTHAVEQRELYLQEVNNRDNNSGY